MALVRWNPFVRWSPFQEMLDMTREMQSMLRQMPGLLGESRSEESQERFTPAVDVAARGDDVVIRVELPGIDPEKDVDISLEGNMLRVSGQRKAERKEEKEGYFFREMRYGSFERSLALPENITEEAITAEYRDGVLEVKIAGAAKELERPQVKRIEVRKPESQQLPKAA